MHVFFCQRCLLLFELQVVCEFSLHLFANKLPIKVNYTFCTEYHVGNFDNFAVHNQYVRTVKMLSRKCSVTRDKICLKESFFILVIN